MTLLEQLRRDEGVRAKAYQDTQGVWTVGVGHNLSQPLSVDAINQILADDVQTAETACLALPIWGDLSPARKGVLLNLCFNIGFTGLMQFRKMYAALEQRDYALAARELLDSRYAAQVGARAHRLAKQLETDEWI